MNRISNAGRIAVLFLAACLTVSITGCSAKVNTSNSGSSGESNSASGENTSAADDSNLVTQVDQSTGETVYVDPNTGETVSVSPGAATASGSKSGGTSSKSSSGFKEPVYDLKGRVITIASEDSVPDMSKKTIFNESIKLTEKKYNCKFKFIQKTDYEGLYQTLINDHAAGSASYDVVSLRGYDVYPNAANSGAILELEKYYNFSGDPTWQNATFKTVGTFRSHWYGMSYVPNEVGIGIWYNRGLLRKYNVPDLWTYVSNNTWNFNTFRAVCRKLTKDTNGDGKPDIWAFTSEDPWLNFVNANGGSLLTTTGSSPKITLDSAKSLEALQFVSDMFLVDNTIPDGAELGAITSSPFNAMTTGKVAMFTYHARYGAVLESYGIPSKDIGWVYMPKGPSATSYTTSTGTMSAMYVIPRAAKDPTKLVAAVQDLCAYWDSSRTVKHKITDKTDELYNALTSSIDSNAKKVLYFQATSPTYTTANNYNLSEILQNQLWPSILKQTKSVKSAVASYKSALQTELTNKYKGTAVSG